MNFKIITNTFICTKENPWDNRSLPVLHIDGDFVDDTNILVCPNCGHSWSLGPDI
jgi:hypothetical protein